MTDDYKQARFFHGEESFKRVATICIGSGRFLRAVLVPVAEQLGGVILFQPRGTDFVEYLYKNNGIYEVDTIQRDDSVQHTQHKIETCGSLSNEKDRNLLVSLPYMLPNLKIIGIGVTEGGFSAKNQAIISLTDLLQSIYKNQISTGHLSQISIINTDNVFMNGSKLNELAKTVVSNLKFDDLESFLEWMNEYVTFHNTMVDRITSYRDNEPNVPRAEPLPSKALVIEDLNRRLPPVLRSLSSFGVLVCEESGELENYASLKLRIANGTHTALVYSLALCGLQGTSSSLIKHSEFLKLINGIFWRDIYPAISNKLKHVAENTYLEWIKRLHHPYFELGSFFICQNSIQKLNFRLIPTIISLINSEEREPSSLLAFSVASMLRFLTPSSVPNDQDTCFFNGKFIPINTNSKDVVLEYASNLTVNLGSGEYTFSESFEKKLPRHLFELFSKLKSTGFDLLHEGYQLGMSNLLKEIFNLKNVDENKQITLWYSWFEKIKKYYCKIVLDESMGYNHLLTLRDFIQAECWVEEKDLERIVIKVVEETPAVDVHTHIFPASHGDLLLHGIDELLTYHYLVAEYFMVCESNIIPENFYKLPKRQQADMIWNELFINRSPISEPCQGVLTTLYELGLEKYVETKNLQKIREWIEQFSIEEYVDLVFRIANVKYVVMTNIPYDESEKKVWLNSTAANKVDALHNDRFHSALRIDAFLKNDQKLISNILVTNGFEASENGLRDYLENWIKIMSPDYIIAAPPIDFEYPSKNSVLDQVIVRRFLLMLPLARKHSLAVVLKFGCEKLINPQLELAGDGVRTVDLKPLINMCLHNPNNKFMATFLSRVNQHELCVVANKFRNLHIYGCWWYLNNPSMIKEITQMRIEMLGTGVTLQHSDARVLDQLIYKWKHSRRVISETLVEKYKDLLKTGWKITEANIRRDVERYLGVAYEDFLKK